VGMKPYSQDLRDKVMAAVAAGQQSNRKLAAAFGISESVIEKWTRRLRETGSTAALPHAGGPVRVLAAHADLIRAQVKAQPDMTLEELCAHVQTETGTRARLNMMSRELQRLKLRRKKSPSTTASAKRTG
jgi:transposase